MNNVQKPLPKSALIPLGSTAAAAATDSANQNNIFGSGMTTLVISNEEANDIMKIINPDLGEGGNFAPLLFFF